MPENSGNKCLFFKSTFDIERAIARKLLFEVNPEIHTYVEEQEDGED
ncbi:hypothetical protein LC593_03890 [Nostoc sp. CHAB 5844]|nr:hypothetical protein [Nostoc sp. CHAB 5844]